MIMVRSTGTFLNGARRELGKVSWPTKKQTIKLTSLVIIISLVVGLYLGSTDWLLKLILEKLVLK